MFRILKYVRLYDAQKIGSTRALSSTIWASLLSNKNKSSTSEMGQRTVNVLNIRDALIRSKQPRKSLRDGDILPETLASEFCTYYQTISAKTVLCGISYGQFHEKVDIHGEFENLQISFAVLVIHAETACELSLKSEALQVDKITVFTTLAQDFGLDHEMVTNIAEDIKRTKEQEVTLQLKLEEKLQHSLEPPYIVLLSYIGQQEGGVKFIVDLRKDLLDILSDRELNCARDELIAVNHSIRHLLSMWFSVGFLNMERVTWQSPCDITEKVANYEAVHEVRDWKDMKKRIGPYRRCYVFMHPSMPREPVCVLHIALRDAVPASIQNILTEEIPSVEQDVDKKNTAVFYSVSSTQTGLAEIDLGNSLIREAVNQLKYDLPNIQTFVTLSPIPGFYKWLEKKLMETSESSVIARIMDHDSINIEGRSILENFVKKPFNVNFKDELCEVLRKPLMEICASYLYHDKTSGFAYDPVANFHLRNGAIIWRLNWKADVSKKGALSSLGMMVNYKYSLDEVGENSRQYFLRGNVAASQDFMNNLPQM